METKTIREGKVMERLQVIESCVAWKRDKEKEIERLRRYEDYESYIKMLVMEKELEDSVTAIINRHEWLRNIH